jgi:hypothetical protein
MTLDVHHAPSLALTDISSRFHGCPSGWPFLILESCNTWIAVRICGGSRILCRGAVGVRSVSPQPVATPALLPIPAVGRQHGLDEDADGNPETAQSLRQYDTLLKALELAIGIETGRTP